MFYFHFSRKERANAKLKRSAKPDGYSPFYSHDVTTDTFDVFRNAIPFLNQKGANAHRETQKET